MTDLNRDPLQGKKRVRIGAALERTDQPVTSGVQKDDDGRRVLDDLKKARLDIGDDNPDDPDDLFNFMDEDPDEIVIENPTVVRPAHDTQPVKPIRDGNGNKKRGRWGCRRLFGLGFAALLLCGVITFLYLGGYINLYIPGAEDAIQSAATYLAPQEPQALATATPRNDPSGESQVLNTPTPTVTTEILVITMTFTPQISPTSTLTPTLSAVCRQMPTLNGCPQASQPTLEGEG